MKSIAAGSVTLALLLSACAGQQQPPAPPPLKIVTEAPTELQRDATTADRSAVTRPAASQGAGRNQRASARRQMARLPNGRIHDLSVQPETGASGRLRASAHHGHSASAGRDDHRRCAGRYRALDGDAGRLRRPAQCRSSSGGEATGSGDRDQPDDLHDEAHLSPAAAVARGARCRRSSSTIPTSWPRR